MDTKKVSDLKLEKGGLDELNDWFVVPMIDLISGMVSIETEFNHHDEEKHRFRLALLDVILEKANDVYKCIDNFVIEFDKVKEISEQDVIDKIHEWGSTEEQ